MQEHAFLYFAADGCKIVDRIIAPLDQFLTLAYEKTLPPRTLLDLLDLGMLLPAVREYYAVDGCAISRELLQTIGTIVYEPPRSRALRLERTPPPARDLTRLEHEVHRCAH